ncbi:amidohydrolase family protein [Actinophytocola sp.]|uniref:amidohydrolase family protein n=1 Tax=Actinophytocola sp. TaxID=1872138 RepID=UPI003D6AA704
MLVTDAQVHVWERSTGVPPAWSVMHRDELTADQLLAVMADAGVDRAVLVPPAFERDRHRNRTCLAAAVAHPDRFAVMGRLDLTAPADLDGWCDQPGMLGIRLSFSRGAATRQLHDGTADWFWPRAEAAGIPLSVFAPSLLGPLDAVAGRHPRLRLTVDHCGLGIGATEVGPVIDELVGLARHENVAVKASCLPSNATDGYPFRSLYDHIHRVVDAFGPRRVFWGSDLTRLPCGYARARSHFTDELDFLDGEELEWVMGRGIAEWLGWPS